MTINTLATATLFMTMLDKIAVSFEMMMKIQKLICVKFFNTIKELEKKSENL